MGTTILAWLITILGLLMIAGGIWDLVDLWNQRRLTEIPLRHWGSAIAMICGGFGMLGIAQAANSPKNDFLNWTLSKRRRGISECRGSVGVEQVDDGERA